MKNLNKHIRDLFPIIVTFFVYIKKCIVLIFYILLAPIEKIKIKLRSEMYQLQGVLRLLRRWRSQERLSDEQITKLLKIFLSLFGVPYPNHYTDDVPTIPFIDAFDVVAESPFSEDLKGDLIETKEEMRNNGSSDREIFLFLLENFGDSFIGRIINWFHPTTKTEK